MREKHRTALAWFTVTTVALLVAAACGAAATPTPSPATPTPGATPTAAETPAVTPTPEGKIGGTVSVYGTWGGSEQESFMAMVKPFEDQTGVTVQYTGTRDLNAVLITGVASGILPDLAGLPGPGQMAQFAKAGKLIDLSTVLDVATYTSETSAGFVDLGTVDGKLVGVFIKSAVKGLIWYNPKVYTAGAPATWDALQAEADKVKAAGTAPWCVGLESGAASGWPGTDWIEDIILRQSGPEVYDKWVAGQQKWTSPEIKAAFETFGKVVAGDSVYGGPTAVLSTFFGDAGNPLFTSPPGCYFHHQASFITDFFVKANPGIVAGTDFDFFPFPDINATYAGAVTGAGDLFGMFHDTPQARALMQYLVTAEAQSIWVGRGGALSGNKNVTNYPDETSRRSAEILANAKVFRFDGSDLMPEEMNSAFWKAMLDFTQDQSKLDEILAGLDKVQADAYQ